MRKFLYSKWFYLALAIVCAIDLLADVGDELWAWSFLNKVAIAMDCCALCLTVWIFADLHSRKPRDVENPRR